MINKVEFLQELIATGDKMFDPEADFCVVLQTRATVQQLRERPEYRAALHELLDNAIDEDEHGQT